VAVIGANDRPSRIPSAEACLEGQPVTERAISECARAVSAAVNPMNDVHASADYRRSLVGTMSERALRDALTR
jgi:CO/xanthine dehydrogenase FAD-binding subunit